MYDVHRYQSIIVYNITPQSSQNHYET